MSEESAKSPKLWKGWKCQSEIKKKTTSTSVREEYPIYKQLSYKQCNLNIGKKIKTKSELMDKVMLLLEKKTSYPHTVPKWTNLHFGSHSGSY